VAKGLAQVYDNPYHNGRSVILILQVGRNGKKFKNRDREI
jgi:hypothetical protein